MAPSQLMEWLASVPPRLRDAAIEDHLGIAEPPSDVPPGEHLIGYHPSGVAPIVRMLIDVPVGRDDVVVDLGAGLGKVLLLTRLLTGARARGIELQPALVARARTAAAACGAEVTFEEGDARTAALDGGTVFFLYAPFTGPVLAEVLQRLRRVAEDHAIVVCALGVDLDGEAPWLSRRPSDSFWLTIYDSVRDGVAARARGARALVAAESLVEAVASERPLASGFHP